MLDLCRQAVWHPRPLLHVEVYLLTVHVACRRRQRSLMAQRQQGAT